MSEMQSLPEPAASNEIPSLHGIGSSSTLDGQIEGIEISNKILDIIVQYALNKFDDTKERFSAGRSKFLSVIERFVSADTQVKMCLPAFPFKSANKVYKVLGILPDKAEELSLERLDTMCMRIEEVYSPGARITIISDGLVYNGMSPAYERVLRFPYGDV